MLMATIDNTAIDMSKSTRKPADPCKVALGSALLAVDAAIIEMRTKLRALGIDPDPVIEPLWEGYHATSENADRALARLGK